MKRPVLWALAALFGAGALSSCELFNSIFDTTAPDPVTGLTATYTGRRSVTLTWTRSFTEDTKHVEISVSPGDAANVTVSLDTESYVVADILLDVDYTFTVTVVDEAENRSDAVASLSVPSVLYEEDFEATGWDDSFWVLAENAPSHHDGVLELSNPSALRSVDPLGAGDDVVVEVVLRSTDSAAGAPFQALAIEILEPGGLHYSETGHVNTDSELWADITWDGTLGLFTDLGATFSGVTRADTGYDTFEVRWDATQITLSVNGVEGALSNLESLRGAYWGGSEFIIGSDVPDPAAGFTLLLNHFAPDNTQIDSIRVYRP